MLHYFTHEILMEMNYRAAGRQIAIQALLTFSENELAKLSPSEQEEESNFNSIIYLAEQISISKKGVLNLEDFVSDIKALFFE